jgi:hypothetical protein
VGPAREVGGRWYYFGMRFSPNRRRMLPDFMTVTHGASSTERVSIFPDGDLKCLPLYGDLAAQGRLFDRQRLGLEVRRLAVHRFKNDGSAELDPVLRSHLGLDEKKENGSR